MLLKIYPDNPDLKKIRHVVSALKNGAVIIYPTDSVYALGCDVNNSKAIERICKIKGLKPEKANFSLVCNDLSNISEFTRQFDTSTYKLLKKSLPGPFTFILEANSNVPKMFNRTKKKTIGIRVPDNIIPRMLANELGSPLISSSIYDEDAILEYTTDPELIEENYGGMVDIVIDGGYGGNIPTTVVNLTTPEPEIIRQGAGNLEEYL